MTFHKSRILIVDDLHLVRDAMRAIVSQEPDFIVSGAVPCNMQVLSVVRACRPHLVLMNVSSGRSTAFHLMRSIAEELPSVCILAYGLHDHDIFHAERAWLAGAMGYVSCTDTTKVMLYAIRRVLKGEIHLGKHLQTRLLRKTRRSGGPSRTDPIEALSDRELEVFLLISQGYCTKAIAAKLSLSGKTIETYRERLRSKLQLKDGSELLQYAILYSRMAGPAYVVPQPVFSRSNEGLLAQATGT